MNRIIIITGIFVMSVFTTLRCQQLVDIDYEVKTSNYFNRGFAAGVLTGDSSHLVVNFADTDLVLLDLMGNEVRRLDKRQLLTHIKEYFTEECFFDENTLLTSSQLQSFSKMIPDHLAFGRPVKTPSGLIACQVFWSFVDINKNQVLQKCFLLKLDDNLDLKTIFPVELIWIENSDSVDSDHSNKGIWFDTEDVFFLAKFNTIDTLSLFNKYEMNKSGKYVFKEPYYGIGAPKVELYDMSSFRTKIKLRNYDLLHNGKTLLKLLKNDIVVDTIDMHLGRKQYLGHLLSPFLLDSNRFFCLIIDAQCDDMLGKVGCGIDQYKVVESSSDFKKKRVLEQYDARDYTISSLIGLEEGKVAIFVFNKKRNHFFLKIYKRHD